MRYDKRYADFVRRIKMKVLDLLLLRKIISLGFPVSLCKCFLVGFFTIAIWMSGLLGKNPQAVNQIALNLSSMTYMFAMGLGLPGSALVTKKGKRDFVSLRRVAISIFFLIILLDAVFMVSF